jgi:hypothetical protein
MSCNIDSVHTPVLKAWMHAKDVVRLCEEEALAECNFLEEMIEEAEAADGEKKLKITSFDWYGEGSGRNHGVLINEIAPKIMGEVEAIFSWEGGYSVTGLLIKDGRVAECGVEQRLIKPAGW